MGQKASSFSNEHGLNREECQRLIVMFVLQSYEILMCSCFLVIPTNLQNAPGAPWMFIPRTSQITIIFIFSLYAIETNSIFGTMFLFYAYLFFRYLEAIDIRYNMMVRIFHNSTEFKVKQRGILLAMTNARLYKHKQQYTDTHNNMNALKIKSTSN